MAERLLASRVADGRGRGHHGPLTFDHLAAWYLDDYLVRRLRTVDTARGRVANLRATFGGQPATVMTTEAIRSYQRTGLAAGAAAATVKRETSALSRMLQLAIRAGATTGRSFRSDWRHAGRAKGSSNMRTPKRSAGTSHPRTKMSSTSPTTRAGGSVRFWSCAGAKSDEGGGVVRLSPERSNTRVGRVLPIVPPIAAVLARRRAQRQGEDPVVFRRDAVTVRAWRTAWPEACRRAGVLGRLLHDCRRTAARNLVRAGVPERVAMQLTGHRSRAVFDRYNIVREDELHQAGARLVAYVAAQAARAPSPAGSVARDAWAGSEAPQPGGPPMSPPDAFGAADRKTVAAAPSRTSCIGHVTTSVWSRTCSTCRRWPRRRRRRTGCRRPPVRRFATSTGRRAMSCAGHSIGCPSRS